MINLLTCLYPSTPITKKTILNKLKFYSASRFAIRKIANLALPIVFHIENFFVGSHKIDNNFQEGLIVSLTSFPARIDKLWLVIETILRQTTKPEKLILWLSKEQFPNISILPTRLLNQQKRGLEIILCDGDIRSHKKYFYCLSQHPDYDFITIDDDFFYPTKMIENLLKHDDGESIVAHRAYRIGFTATDKISSYSKWELLPDTKEQGLSLFATSGGGTLFPVGSLHSEVLNSDVFLDLCPLADDVWLYFSAVANNTKTIKTDYKSNFIPVLNKKNQTLSSINVGESLNDKQINNLLTYYKHEKSIDIETLLSDRVNSTRKCNA